MPLRLPARLVGEASGTSRAFWRHLMSLSQQAAAASRLKRKRLSVRWLSLRLPRACAAYRTHILTRNSLPLLICLAEDPAIAYLQKFRAAHRQSVSFRAVAVFCSFAPECDSSCSTHQHRGERETRAMTKRGSGQIERQADFMAAPPAESCSIWTEEIRATVHYSSSHEV